MSFIDNPVIAGLGAQLGLGDMFDSIKAAGTAPTAPTAEAPPQQATPVVKPAHSAPNVPEYKNRPYIPRQISSSGGGVQPGAGGMPVSPGYMDPATLQDPNVKALLGQYGVTPPTTPPDPNLFLHNPAAYQKHPVLANMLERGLDSLANSHPGANFMQSFTGQLKGNQEAAAERSAQVNAQTMAPVSQAMAIQQLQEKYDQHLKANDDMVYHQGMLNYYNKLADDKENKYLNVLPHFNKETGEFTSLQADPKSATGYSWQIDPTLGRDEKTYQRHQYVTKSIKDIADQKYGGDTSKVSPVEILGVISDLESQTSKDKATGPNIGKQITADASVKRARIMASRPAGAGYGDGGPKMNPADTLDYKTSDTELKNVNSRLNSISDVSKPYQDEQGNILVPHSTQYKNEVQRLKDRQSAASQKQQNILKKYGAANATPGPSATPKYSSKNPFANN